MRTQDEQWQDYLERNPQTQVCLQNGAVIPWNSLRNMTLAQLQELTRQALRFPSEQNPEINK